MKGGETGGGRLEEAEEVVLAGDGEVGGGGGGALLGPLLAHLAPARLPPAQTPGVLSQAPPSVELIQMERWDSAFLERFSLRGSGERGGRAAWSGTAASTVEPPASHLSMLTLDVAGGSPWAHTNRRLQSSNAAKEAANFGGGRLG